MFNPTRRGGSKPPLRVGLNEKHPETLNQHSASWLPIHKISGPRARGIVFVAYAMLPMNPFIRWLPLAADHVDQQRRTSPRQTSFLDELRITARADRSNAGDRNRIHCGVIRLTRSSAHEEFLVPPSVLDAATVFDRIRIGLPASSQWLRISSGPPSHNVFSGRAGRLRGDSCERFERTGNQDSGSVRHVRSAARQYGPHHFVHPVFSHGSAQCQCRHWMFRTHFMKPA